MKISLLLWLHNKSSLSQEKNCFSKMVWHFIGVYIINRTLNGRLRDTKFLFECNILYFPLPVSFSNGFSLELSKFEVSIERDGEKEVEHNISTLFLQLT